MAERTELTTSTPAPSRRLPQTGPGRWRRGGDGRQLRDRTLMAGPAVNASSGSRAIAWPCRSIAARTDGGAVLAVLVA
jgi:hypothetical protein